MAASLPMRRIFLSAVLLLVPAAPCAEPAELAGMRLDLPDPAAGWTQAPAPGQGIVLRRDQGATRTLIAVLPPTALGGRSFDDAFQGFSRLDILPDGRPLLTRRGLTVNGHPMIRSIRCCAARNGATTEAHFVGIDSPRGAIFMMLLIAGISGRQTSPIEAEFAAIVRSLRPGPGDRALDFAPAPGNAGLEGLYTAFSVSLRPNPFGGMDSVAVNATRWFDRSGLYGSAIPAGGDLARHCRARPTECGVYRLVEAPRTMLVLDDVQDDFGLMQREEQPLTREADGLLLGNRRWRRVQPFPIGARLEGTWRHFAYSGGQTPTGSGGVALERLFVFAADGRYTRAGFTGATSTQQAGNTQTGVITGGKRPAEGGTYRLEGHALVLTGPDGRDETLSIFRPDPASDGLLVIDGANYLRRDR